MAEYTNFDLKKFIAENKKANVVKENTQGFDALMDAVDDYIDPSHPDHERLAQEVEKALDNGDIDTLEFSHSLSAPSREVEFIANQLGIEPQTSEETVSELDGTGSVDALTAILGAGGLTAGAFALNKIMDALEAGKLGDKGKAVAKHLRDMGNTFSKGGAPMMEETTVELTKEEAFKKQITDILLSENKSTANSKVVSERKRNIFGMETEGFGDKISNAVSGIGAKISGGNAAILQKAISASGLKVGTPLYSNHNQWDASHNGKVVYTIEKIDYKTGEAIMSATVDGKDIPRYTEEATKGFTKNLKDIINAEPEKAQQLANEFIQGAKEEFSKGKLSYKPIQSK